jgi:acyl-CoA thioesterase
MTEDFKKKHSDKAPQETGPHRVHFEGWIDCSPFEKLLNIQIVEASDGKAILKMPFLFDYAQANGFVHGGALVSLADTAIVMAIKSLLPPATLLLTESLEARFIQAVKNGIITAIAKVVKQEGSRLLCEATLYNNAMKPVMEVSSVFKIGTGAQVLDSR